RDHHGRDWMHRGFGADRGEVAAADVIRRTSTRAARSCGPSWPGGLRGRLLLIRWIGEGSVSWRSGALGPDLVDDPGRAVDLVERLEQGGAVHGHRAVDRSIEAVVAAQRVDVPIEDEPADASLPIHHGRAGVAADDVIG